MAKLKFEVSIEKAIHDGVQSFLEGIYNRYGLKVKQVDVCWFDTSGCGEPRHTIAELRLITETNY